MSKETQELIAIAIVTIAQLYVIDSSMLSRHIAAVFDFIARVCGRLANSLANTAMAARLRYYEVLNDSTV